MSEGIEEKKNIQAKEYFDGNELAANKYLEKYALINPHTKEILEPTPEQMHRRLAKEFARVLNMPEDAIFQYFDKFKYIIPQGSVMNMLGNPYVIGSLSNCVVLPELHDSYGGITYADSQLTALYKRRCGVGLDISPLRPEKGQVKNAARSSTGAVSFMNRFSETTREVAQNGRRGALMITMDIRHPDVEKFALIKQDLSKITGANISIILRDEFMEAVENDEDYILRFPCDIYPSLDSGISLDQLEYNELTKGALGYYKKIRAKELWETIIKCAHGTAEPGLMFRDRHINYSPDGIYEDYRGHTSNPCSEIWMGRDTCRLISENLFSVVVDPFTPNAKIDKKLLYDICYVQQKLGDAIVDLEIEHIDRILDKIDADPEPDHIKRIERETWEQLQESAKNGRRTGCGFTGLGDMLAALGVPYDSDQALSIVEDVMKVKFRAELRCSIDLAKEKGAFKGWDPELELKASEDPNSFYYMVRNEFPHLWNKMQKHGRRNVSLSTVAPNGTVSIMTGTTSGIEPLYLPYYIRKTKINPDDEGMRVDSVDDSGDEWMHYPILHPKFKEWMNKTWDYNEIMGDHFTPANLDEAFKQSPWYGSTANEIDWIKRVKLQSIIQKYTTHSISSTINLPEDVTLNEVSDIYFESWKAGLKGITIYRDNCRTGVLVSNDKKDDEFEYHNAPKRPNELKCDIHRMTALGKRWMNIVGLYEDKYPYEIFALPEPDASVFPKKWKTGKLVRVKQGVYNLQSNGDVLEDISQYMQSDDERESTRERSLQLRHGIHPKWIVKEIEKSPGHINSFNKAVARTLKKYLSVHDLDVPRRLEGCDELNECNIIFEEGCVKCTSCGNTKCS